MRKQLLVALAATLLAIPIQRGSAADKADAKSELQELVTKIRTKLEQDKKTEEELAAELKQFDALLTAHKNEKTDDVAQILFMKAMLYVQVFEKTDKGIEMLKKLKTDFPETEGAKKIDNIIASIQKQKEIQERISKIQSALAKGAKFPDFDEKDLAGKPLSIANYKGKVVLVDFWATWCGPCVRELPNVLKAYEKYHAKGFEIVGISLDQDKEALTSFIKKRGMPWAQYFDGKGWENKLAEKYGVNSIPATFLLDGEGKILAKGEIDPKAGTLFDGEGLEAALEKALAK